LKEDSTGVTLSIPTAFISYHGEALDMKVPLLRSMEALNVQALRVLLALGNTVSKRIVTTIGPEQEYFLVDKELADARLDLMLTGRTLFGARPPKCQEMEDHYFGIIKDRVFDFMRELNVELWKLGISSKTQHNEVAPNQFELATIFTSANVATDWNQLVMETMKRVATRHGLTALLHEKPFAGVNGSGKHNNWSISTNDGLNLLEPGSSPQDNAQFLLFLAAVIKAVDVYAPLLRSSAANTGNDHRLGANEAPPAIISMFLGDALSDLLEKLSKGQTVKSGSKGKLEIGVTSLPKLPRDLTDRNRTSPFAFTGNKFEFRMVPSSESVSNPNTVLNTVVAEVLSDFADILEKAKDKATAIKNIVIETYKAHKRVIYNGNNYSEAWVKEAEKRGLPHIRSTVEAIPEMAKPEIVKLFTKHKVLKKEELESRKVIYLEKYIKQINIEARTMVNMANREIFSAVLSYAGEVAANIAAVKSVSVDIDVTVEESLLKDIMENLKSLKEHTKALEGLIAEGEDGEGDIYKHALFYKDHIFAKMAGVRYYADKLESLVDKASWPFPTYEDLLFRL
ncbi:MAG: glutamine synthetase III, partial [Spirochaetales bacterium]|nr:glutamine synthetase III [Spirochaetales bacterium]